MHVAEKEPEIDSGQKQVHPAHNLRRWMRRRPFRLMCGLYLAEDFTQVHGVLMASQSGGKWLKPKVYRSVSLDVPEILQQMIGEVLSAGTVELRQLPSILQDLAGVQSEVIETLLTGSVNQFENVLAVCVGGASLWVRDFDGRPICYSLCDPERISEKTGLSVIDSLHTRDIVVGGNGGPIFPLPYWLMFGDRDPKVSTKSRLLVDLDDDLRLTTLPPSDGLDSEIPPIQFSILPGGSLLSEICREQYNQKQPPTSSLSQIAVQGKMQSDLLDAWKSQTQQQKIGWYAKGQSSSEVQSYVDGLVSELATQVQQSKIGFTDAVCTTHHLWVHYIEKFIDRSIVQATEGSKPEDSLEINEVIFAGAAAENGMIRRVVQESFPDINIVGLDQFKLTPKLLPVAAVATLGFMYVDQLPATIPKLTGAEYPRILGRLTPGRPSSWRQLLTEMADYRPPTMKLREAV